MATAADKKRWDKLRADLIATSEAQASLEREMNVKYGSGQEAWWPRGVKTKIAKLRDRRSRLGDKFFDLLVRVSPRGERWLSGVPSWWIIEKLTWEDAIRPANEALSVVVPGAYGTPDGTMKERDRMAREVDFDDEDAVLAEMAHELNIPLDDLRIDEDRGLTSFGVGAVYAITLGGVYKNSSKEWKVIQDEDEFRELALEIVKQDLEEDPSLFNQNFIESHINMDRLRRDLEGDLLNSRIDDLTDAADRRPDDFWDDYESAGFEAPEEDEDGDRRDPDSTEIEELAEKQVEEELRDPMAYLEDIYGDEAAAKAIEIAGFDLDAAAEDAVDTDGPAHFVARYDSNYYETPSGFVYWRDN